MSTMKFSRKPPLAKSPIRTRPRRALRPTTSMSVQTPPGSLTKSAAPLCRWEAEVTDARPEFRSISCELRALARMADSEIESETYRTGFGKSPLFERGRLYDVYSAKRNERLKRKLGIEMEDEVVNVKKGSVDDMEYVVGSVKRRDSKRMETGRKSVAVDFLGDRSQHPRYSLRSSKENKKPPLSASFDHLYGVDGGVKKSVASGRRVVRKI